jgi:hypothetical protein
MRYITAELGCNKPLEGFRRAQIGKFYTILEIFRGGRNKVMVDFLAHVSLDCESG